MAIKTFMRQEQIDYEIVYRIIEVLNSHIDGNYLHCGTIASRICARYPSADVNATIISGYVRQYKLQHFHGVERSGELLCIPKHKRLPPQSLPETVRVWMSDVLPNKTMEKQDAFTVQPDHSLPFSRRDAGSSSSSSYKIQSTQVNSSTCFSHCPGTTLSWHINVAFCESCSATWRVRPCNHIPTITSLGVICARCGVHFDGPTS